MSETSHDAAQTYRNGLDLISGVRGTSSADAFRKGFDLIKKAGEKLPPARAHKAALSIMGFEQVTVAEQIAEDILQAAISGFPPAVRGVAVLLLAKEDSQAMGAGLLRRAAKNGDWIAALLIVREAMRGRFLASPAELSALSASMSAAVPLHADITRWAAAIPESAAPLDVAAFSQQVCKAALMRALTENGSLARNTLAEYPHVAVMTSILTPLECDYLMAISAALMQPSKVVDAEKGEAVPAGYRTSDGAVLLPAHIDVVTALIVGKLSRAAAIPQDRGEFISLLRYKPGQEYHPHHDYLQSDAQDYSQVKRCGQRASTLLTYLNGGYDGGETAFPDLNLRYKGGAGDGLLFENIDTGGVPIPSSLHAGLPVTSGEKWLATLWCREKVFWPWMR